MTSRLLQVFKRFAAGQAIPSVSFFSSSAAVAVTTVGGLSSFDVGVRIGWQYSAIKF